MTTRVSAGGAAPNPHRSTGIGRRLRRNAGAGRRLVHGMACTSALAVFIAGCDSAMPQPDDPANADVNVNAAPDVPANANESETTDDVVWSRAFDATEVGLLTAVWGSGPDDVFVVGGQNDAGEVYHYDGVVWKGMALPRVSRLHWVFGFGPDDVYAVGKSGAVVHYDGESWSALNSGTTRDLWGIWGTAPDDMWVVGGDGDAGVPVILYFNGAKFEEVSVPENDRNATALFKVWGIGSKIIAVGGDGLILEYDGSAWVPMPADDGDQEANAEADDLLALWGTSPDNVVAVGGRSRARIVVYDGVRWTTHAYSSVPGMNAVFMVSADASIVGGQNGYVGSFDPSTGVVHAENSNATLTIRGIWSDGQGRFYAVGGVESEPASGLALVRTHGDPGITVLPPEPAPEPEIIEPTLEIGVANGERYRTLEDGDDMQLFSLGQGGTHMFLSYRTTGFAPDAEVMITISGVRAEDERVAIGEFTQVDRLVEIAPGVNERLDRLVRIDSLFPSEIVERDILLTVTVTDAFDPAITATVVRRLHLLSPT